MVVLNNELLTPKELFECHGYSIEDTKRLLVPCGPTLRLFRELSRTEGNRNPLVREQGMVERQKH